MTENRRKFPRFELPEGTVATNEAGQLLGVVERAGAGGLRIRYTPESPAAGFKAGDTLRIVVKSGTGVQHKIPVEIRYNQDGAAGVRFLPKAASAGQ